MGIAGLVFFIVGCIGRTWSRVSYVDASTTKLIGIGLAQTVIKLISWFFIITGLLAMLAACAAG